MIKASIVGGTGYTGAELLRLLAQHPEVELVSITSRSEQGVAVSDLYPNLRGHVDLVFVDPEQAALSNCDVVFYATPNGTAMQHVPALLADGVRIIDLAADFRLRDPGQWRRWYKMPHACPALLQDAVYGLPEVNRAAIREARLVANPGCYATTVELGFLPLLENNVIDPTQLIADGKSGVSGAGRTAQQHTLMCEAGDNFQAYGAAGHRHLPEIRQLLYDVCKQTIGLTFVPHLTPMIRGIHATLYGTLIDTAADLQSLYEQRYANEPFVDILPAGSHPQTRSVRGANVCRIAVHRPQDGPIAVVLSITDNLVKGAAGQAVQNMNIMFGCAETAGLHNIALLP